MHVTQGTFSFLPDLTDRQISDQIEYCLRQEWAVSVEFTDDVHPRNTYWEMWGIPMFDLRDAAGVMAEVRACREANPNVYVRVTAFDSTRGWETVRLSFLVQRPANEPGFRLDRLEAEGRTIRYSVHPYAADQPAGRRYKPEQANTAPGDRR
ncbi:MAG: ribulose bisphosphate carboxylase small subunit [Hyphomicrobiales bacterium]|jgi:ribulose-bisphosphate carboxylase small chain|nr:ribulose bisphosphate carboxylase small subunit [Hyphomicrobiales bacterium]MDE1973665.1 ribulose bisphosphate carboxylase small subunit [Hyphomicrobiales bacterium]